MCGQVRLVISGRYLIDLDVILAVSFGWFETAQRKGDYMSWDVSYIDVSYTAPREIRAYESPRRSEIRNTKTTNVKRGSALLLVNYAIECVPAATCTG